MISLLAVFRFPFRADLFNQNQFQRVQQQRDKWLLGLLSAKLEIFGTV